ncbi:MAG: PDDEXK nuclease domain-containing protein [Desulfococcaceae bacterium]|jgi:predicted nuclease of restriction endonuclease-like (RecB) superfamily|nr:PDDEXK nuclease domain-containing protein [Desulfococcaceae bacterium]
MNGLFNDNDYISFLKTVKSEIQSARIRAAKTVNRELISLYWKIGEMIVEKQEKLGWGKSVVEQLSKDIRKEFDGIAGYSARNLWDMKRFYEQYQANSKLRQLVAEIPWGHNLLIINKIKQEDAREYYLKASKDYGWSRNVLLNQIKADAYSRHKLSDKQHNFDNVMPKHLAEQADETMKDSYMLDFLGITTPVLERELENRMVEKIRDVIIELGQGFAFIGNQYKIKAEDREYYIDLLFYHRKLKCLVAFELKAGKFKPEYAGKMNFYLNLLDDFVREDGEEPSIGIILCAEKDNFEIEYSLRDINKPVGVAEYRLTQKLPEKFKNALPTAEEIKNKLFGE